MNTTEWLPAPDVLPLPATVPVLHFLLLLTFFLHVLFMNCLLGGVLLTAWSRLRSRAPGDEHARLADQYTKLLPTLVAGTVTFGVAPLLFLQVIFGQFFFSSSVIMAWPWFMVVPILLLAYYGTYLQSFAGQKLGTARLPLPGDWRSPLWEAGRTGRGTCRPQPPIALTFCNRSTIVAGCWVLAYRAAAGPCRDKGA